MCGIFGYINIDSTTVSALNKKISRLFGLSESRGKEAAGISICYQHQISVYKDNSPASTMLKTKAYSDYVATIFDSDTMVKSNVALIGHSRLVTNGTQEKNDNNQPIIKDGCVGVHNGIITNVDQLFDQNQTIERKYETDTEILLSLIRKYECETENLIKAVIQTYHDIEGSASIAVMPNDYNHTILATNNGSLYICFSESGDQFVFASEKYILRRLLATDKNFNLGNITGIKPFSGVIINHNNLNVNHFQFAEQADNGAIKKNGRPCPITDFSKNGVKNREVTVDIVHPEALEYNSDSINKLQRCSLCILPETVPFIEFDEHGACSYCRNYQRLYPSKVDEQHKSEALADIIDTYNRQNKSEFDVIVPFSGGRDSSFGLHYLKTQFKLKIITFTYDWGMVTDLARRNIARICGKLGIENILLSADINKKRRYIRQNILAWLKKPDLGMIPLFMAGDKQFLFHTNKLKKATGVKLNIWMGNKLETTDFKSGFAGVAPNFNKVSADKLKFQGNLQLVSHYLKNYFMNPDYLNSSLWDTIGAYYSYYIQPRHDFYLLYDYLKWDEQQIVATLIEQYNWETSPDTKSTWRIGDGTAAFYNYIYYTVAGFTENDTFRSNQIREGMLTREQALSLVNEENQPRFDSLKWYFHTIKVDFDDAIKIINTMPKLYSMEL